jgi:uncharacterized protein
VKTEKNSRAVRLTVKVTPNAGRNEISGEKDGVLLVRIGAPPEKNKANKELVSFLAERLGVKKADIEILRGETGRNKVIEISGVNREDIEKIIPE